MKILIAEDEPVSRRMLQAKMERWGHDVIAVGDGKAAWDILQQKNSPPLAVLDWVMPGLDGITICQNIRKSDNGQPVYIILLTGKTQKEDIAHGLQSGADDYITKPFDNAELRERIMVGVRIVKLQRDLSDRLRELDEAMSKISQAEEALRESHAEKEQLLNSISSILVSIDHKGHIAYWNDMAEAAFCIAAGDVVGRDFSECGIQWNWKAVNEAIETCMKKGAIVHLDDFRYRRTDGQDGFLNISVNPITGDKSFQNGVLMVGVDITRQKILENRLRQSQKLESIGNLAMGIAHEINTPLQYVGDNIHFLHESFVDISRLLEKYDQILKSGAAGQIPADLAGEIENMIGNMDADYLIEEIPLAIEQSLEGVQQASQIIKAVSGFSHPGIDKKSAIDINEAIKNTVTVSHNEWKDVAELDMHLDDSIPHLSCFPGEINQVFLSIIMNAVHAITDVVDAGKAEKGVISISTDYDDGWVEIRISDTGGGIPEDIRSKIFDPFFSTRDVGKGIGQGLTVAHDVVVAKHGGTIDFETIHGRGTTFIIRLPSGAGK